MSLRNISSQFAGVRFWKAAGIVFSALFLTSARTDAQSGVPLRSEERLPRYGGYVPFGVFPRNSGVPYGGYTPFGQDGPGLGLPELDYGLGRDDFARSYVFGEDIGDDYPRWNTPLRFGFPLDMRRPGNICRPGPNRR